MAALRFKRGNPLRPEASRSVIPQADRFHGLHADIRNSDEIIHAFPPLVELDWIAEPSFFVPDGPSLDQGNNVYFSPVSPQENVVLVSLDGETGKRRWSIPGAMQDNLRTRGSGGPLVLNDPDNPGADIIYLGLYDRALAVSPDGEILWDVQTGLAAPRRTADMKYNTHNYGLNYVPEQDALVALLASGHMYALDRKTGRQLLDKPFKVPGSPSMPSKRSRPPAWLLKLIDDNLAKTLGPGTGKGWFSQTMDALLGGENIVANYFAVAPSLGRMYVTSMALDERDGNKDGISEVGALYGLELKQTGEQRYIIEIVAQAFTQGGSGATPTVNAQENRVYVADENGNVLAFDQDLNPIWSLTLPEQIAASLTVASDSTELYAVSLNNIYKIVDRGDHAEHVWTNNLDMYPQLPWHVNTSILTPTLTANGIAVIVGNAFQLGALKLTHKSGVGLMDRETGNLLSYSEGIGEESVSATVLGSDGSFYIGASPIRRAIGQSLFPWMGPALSGGISRIKSADDGVFLAHILCSSLHIEQNAITHSNKNPLSFKRDQQIISSLLGQAQKLVSSSEELVQWRQLVQQQASPARDLASACQATKAALL